MDVMFEATWKLPRIHNAIEYPREYGSSFTNEYNFSGGKWNKSVWKAIWYSSFRPEKYHQKLTLSSLFLCS